MSSDTSDVRDLTFHGTKSAGQGTGETSRTVNWERRGKDLLEAKGVLDKTRAFLVSFFQHDIKLVRKAEVWGHLRYTVS